MKVFLYTLLRAVLLIGVAVLVYFVFGFNRWGVMGAVLSAVVGAVVAFAVGYVFFDRQRRAAAEEFGDAMARRNAKRPAKVSAEERDADIEDNYQDELRRKAGLGSEARTPNLADDEA